MDKIEITVATIGHIPDEFDRQKIKTWKSDIFSINGNIESYTITNDSDGDNWEFSDSNLENLLPDTFNGDFLIAIVNIPLELNWYTRRLSKNRIILTFHEIKEILHEGNIPLENLIYRVLYVYTFLFKSSMRDIPLNEAITNFTHDETRGCIFDMNGHKMDIIYSCNKPKICPDCIEKLRRERISNEIITLAQKEIKNIKKPLFFRIMSFVKKHPIWALFFSVFSAVILGIIGSLIANILYEGMKNQ